MARSAILAAALLFGLLLCFVLWPILRVLAASVAGPNGTATLAHYAEFLGTERLLAILVQTVVVAAVSTVIIVLLGLALAYAVTHARIPGRGIVSVMVELPGVAPPFVVALGLILLTTAVGLERSIEGVRGIVISQVFTFLPHAYRILRQALIGIDPALEEAAENLGAGTLSTLRRITLVLLRPGLVSAGLVVFILCMTDFASPFLIGGGYRVLSTEIYAQVAEGARELGTTAAMAVVLFLPCLLAHALSVAWAGIRGPESLIEAEPVSGRRPPAGVRAALLVVAACVSVAVALLAALVGLGSLVASWGADWSLSLRHYAAASGSGAAWSLWNSIRLATIAGGLGVVLALLTAQVVERRRAAIGPRRALALVAISLLPAAVPGSLAGLGYLLAFDGSSATLLGVPGVLVASVVFWSLPPAVTVAGSAVKGIDPALVEAAVSLGAGPRHTVGHVVLPLVGRPALSMFVDVFHYALATVSAVIFLVGPAFPLAAVASLTSFRSGDAGTACVLGTVLLGTSGVAATIRRALVGTRLIPGVMTKGVAA